MMSQSGDITENNTLRAKNLAQGMKLTLGRHDLAQDFYVMDLPDTNIILGVPVITLRRMAKQR
jgi:hypothetical protein